MNKVRVQLLKICFYSLSFFFRVSAFKNSNTESKSSIKKFDIFPVGTTLNSKELRKTVVTLFFNYCVI